MCPAAAGGVWPIRKRRCPSCPAGRGRAEGQVGQVGAAAAAGLVRIGSRRELTVRMLMYSWAAIWALVRPGDQSHQLLFPGAELSRPGVPEAGPGPRQSASTRTLPRWPSSSPCRVPGRLGPGCPAPAGPRAAVPAAVRNGVPETLVSESAAYVQTVTASAARRVAAHRYPQQFRTSACSRSPARKSSGALPAGGRGALDAAR